MILTYKIQSCHIEKIIHQSHNILIQTQKRLYILSLSLSLSLSCINVYVHAFVMNMGVKNHGKTDLTNQNQPKKLILASFSVSVVNISVNFFI